MRQTRWCVCSCIIYSPFCSHFSQFHVCVFVCFCFSFHKVITLSNLSNCFWTGLIYHYSNSCRKKPLSVISIYQQIHLFCRHNYINGVVAILTYLLFIKESDSTVTVFHWFYNLHSQKGVCYKRWFTCWHSNYFFCHEIFNVYE